MKKLLPILLLIVFAFAALSWAGPSFSIRGKVTLQGSTQGLSSVRVTFTYGSSSKYDDTDSNGNYEIRDVPDNATGTLTPVKTGYAFTPATLSASKNSRDNKNFQAALIKYTISGTVTDRDNEDAPLAGATVTIKDLGTTQTDADGHYSYQVNHGTTTKVTISKTGYEKWQPSEYRFDSPITSNQTDKDFSAELKEYEIKGKVKADGADLQGAILTFSHDGGTITTNDKGDYKYKVKHGTTTTITPSKDGYGQWSPATITLTNVTSNTDRQDFAGKINVYTVSGIITDGTAPLAGVIVTLDWAGPNEMDAKRRDDPEPPPPPANLVDTTDASGAWSFDVNHGTSFALIPEHACYTFVPDTDAVANITADATVDFTGTLITYTLSGVVTDGLAPITGVTITSSWDGSKVLTDTAGLYQVVVGCGHATTLTPSHEGYHGWAPECLTLAAVTGDSAGLNFSGQINIYTITGNVSNGRVPVVGATIAFSHNGGTAVTDAAGNYTYDVPYMTSTTLTPSHPGYSTWFPEEIPLAQIKSDYPEQDFNAQPLAFTVALQFVDEATGAAVGDVMCRLNVPGLQEWKVESKPEMNLLWGKYPYNALFKNFDMALGGTYVINFSAPAGWAFVGDSQLELQVPPAANFYSVSGNVFSLRYTAPQPDPGGEQEPVIDEKPMVFVSGSPAFEQEPWPNVVDEDLDGWDGTGTLGADANGSTWAIFRYRGSKSSTFNYFYLQTANNSMEEIPARWATSVELLYSTGSLEPADFISLGTWAVKSPEFTFYKLSQTIEAKYVMLKVFAPGSDDQWSQVVEFGTSLNKQVTVTPAQPRAEQADVAAVPATFGLSPNYPNPFNPETTLRYQLAEDAHVRLSIYNLSGQEVARLVDGQVSAGTHSQRWNASEMPSGVYLVRLTAGANTAIQRISLVK